MSPSKTLGKFFHFGFALTLTWLSSCSTANKTTNSKLVGLKHSYCTPTVAYQQSVLFWNDSSAIDTTKTHISPHDKLLCQMLGISFYVNQLAVLEKDGFQKRATERLFLMQKINGRLRVAQSELQAIAAELDCEGERSDMAADYLDKLDSKRNRNFTVASVIVASLTTVATVAISGNGGQTAVGVGGGLISAGLGATTINPKGHKLEFLHERNLLRSIWSETEANTDYPGFVWKMLHEKRFSNIGDKTLSMSIKNRWIEFEFDGKVQGDPQTLLFGNGGLYHADDLHTRSSLINQLQSTIRSINQDLTSLVVYIEGL